MVGFGKLLSHLGKAEPGKASAHPALPSAGTYGLFLWGGKEETRALLLPGASLGSQFCSGSRVCPGGLLTLRAKQPLPERFKVFALNPKGRAGSTGGAPGEWGTGQLLASPPLPQKQQRWGAPATQHWEQMTRRDVLVRSCCSPFSTTPCSSPALELSNVYATDPRAG